MRKIFRAFRYSCIGIFFAGVLSSIQGCTQDDSLIALLLLLLMLLGGGSVELSINGTGSGKVIGANIINCTITNGSTTGTCIDQVDLGTTQTLTATPASGFVFDSWSNCSNPSGNMCNHTMTGDTTITANFAVQMFTLTVNLILVNTTNPNLSVVSNIGGIDCPGTCTATFPVGTVVELTAIDDSPATFTTWSGSGCPSSNVGNVNNNVIMNQDVTCNATFQGF